MMTSDPHLPEDATDEMHEFLDEIVSVTTLANGEYEDITSEDMVAVLRHRARLYREYGMEAIHPRNRAEDDDIPELGGMFRETDDGAIDSTDRRWYNFDIGFKTGIMHGRDITDDQMATVCTVLADFLDEYGRDALGSRTLPSE